MSTITRASTNSFSSETTATSIEMDACHQRIRGHPKGTTVACSIDL